jgi:hypothetical protein
MEIPIKVIFPFFFFQPSVLTIVTFKSGKITFQTISRNRDKGIIEIMKHIRQGSKKHTPGSFDIAEYITGFAPGLYLGTILDLPVSDNFKKPVSISRGFNMGNLKEDFSEPSGVCSFRRCTAPGQALPLYMDQASLYYHIRPKFADYFDHLGVAIHSKATRVQANCYQLLEECRQLKVRTLGNTILTSYNRMCFSIHQSNKTAWTMNKSTIHDEVFISSKFRCRKRFLFYMVINNLVKLTYAMSTLVCQLPDRITFNHPTSKPFTFFYTSGSLIIPAIRTFTRLAEPALFFISILTISPKNYGTARTVFFYS